MDAIGLQDLIVGLVGVGVGGGLLYHAQAHARRVEELRKKAEELGHVEEEKPAYIWTAGKTAMMLRPTGLAFVTFLGMVGAIALISGAIGIFTFIGLLVALTGYGIWLVTHIDHRVSAVPNKPPAAPAVTEPAAEAVEPAPAAATPAPGAA
ncbi:hypothetical protein [Blastochloris sulfoviridis]|uniref:Uncharacterized protein n=1 Tax=Blastochloris sulfoviridis TaxID=50712 RepID=A0A5M6I5G0_9HYPH|nr:hypothetical protein [Blastochloris sulfoviridis]KAA5603055.1 hypothetical protein F1193_02160 [Blastochloris sulfoviridis]